MWTMNKNEDLRQKVGILNKNRDSEKNSDFENKSGPGAKLVTWGETGDLKQKWGP